MEAAPESEIEVRAQIQERGLQVVGYVFLSLRVLLSLAVCTHNSNPHLYTAAPDSWYHSHPLFEPRPSVRDLEQQRSYQELLRNSEDAAGNGTDAGAGASACGGAGAEVVCAHDAKPKKLKRSKVPFVGLIVGMCLLSVS